MATQFLGTRFQSFKADGTVNNGGTVEFFEIGTATQKTTYSNSALSVANTWPVTLDSSGSADIWYSGDADVTVKDSTGTIVDTFLNINPVVAAVITGANLINNGSFETGASTTSPDGWVRSEPYAGGTSVQDTDSIHGLYSWKFISIGNGGGVLTSDAFFNVNVELPILVSWSMKSSTATIRNTVEILWYDDASAFISSTTAYDNSTTNYTSWEDVHGQYVPVATAVQAKLRIIGCHSSNATPGTAYFDNVLITQDTTQSVTFLNEVLKNRIF